MKKYTDTAVWETDYRERLKKLMTEKNIHALKISLLLGITRGN